MPQNYRFPSTAAGRWSKAGRSYYPPAVVLNNAFIKIHRIVKPLYFLLLLLLACGFFACTEEIGQPTTELSPQPEGKTLDAAGFAEFTSVMVEFGLFDEDEFGDLEDYGSEDVRLFRHANGELGLDFLTNDGFTGETSVAEVLAHRPARNWHDVIQLSFDEAEAPRLRTWLTDNFSGATHVDLRVSFLVNGTIVISGLRPSVEDLAVFGPVPFV